MTKNKKRKYIILLLLVCAVALAVYLLMELDQEQVTEAFQSMNPWWIILLVGCMVLYYVFDGVKFFLVSKSFGCPMSMVDSMVTSMLGFFYSAVTPLAAGGQPFQIVHLHNKGASISKATSVVCMTYLYWKIALVAVGLAGFIAYYDLLVDVGAAWIPFLLFGMFLQVLSLVVVLLTALLPTTMKTVGDTIIKRIFSLEILSSHGLNATKQLEKWDNFVDEYHTAFSDGTRDIKVIFVQVLCAFLEVIAYMSVAYCTYRGFGMKGEPYYKITLIQAVLYIGASFVPTPGASGASEGGFVLIYKTIFGRHLTMCMLVWRLATYYLTILVGYLVLVIDKLVLKSKQENGPADAAALTSEEQKPQEEPTPDEEQKPQEEYKPKPVEN